MSPNVTSSINNKAEEAQRQQRMSESSLIEMQRSLPCSSSLSSSLSSTGSLSSQASIPDKMRYLSSVIDEVLRELDDGSPFDLEDDFVLPVFGSHTQ